MRLTIRLAGIICIALGFSAYAADTVRTPSPGGASLYIVSPADGDTVSETFAVVFGLAGMGVAPGVQKRSTPDTIT